MKFFALILTLSIGVGVYGFKSNGNSNNNEGIAESDCLYMIYDDTTDEDTTKEKGKKVENIKKRIGIFKRNATKAASGETKSDPKAGLSVTEEGVEEEKENKNKNTKKK